MKSWVSKPPSQVCKIRAVETPCVCHCCHRRRYDEGRFPWPIAQQSDAQRKHRHDFLERRGLACLILQHRNDGLAVGPKLGDHLSGLWVPGWDAVAEAATVDPERTTQFAKPVNRTGQAAHISPSSNTGSPAVVPTPPLLRLSNCQPVHHPHFFWAKPIFRDVNPTIG